MLQARLDMVPVIAKRPQLRGEQFGTLGGRPRRTGGGRYGWLIACGVGR